MPLTRTTLMLVLSRPAGLLRTATSSITSAAAYPRGNPDPGQLPVVPALCPHGGTPWHSLTRPFCSPGLLAKNSPQPDRRHPFVGARQPPSSRFAAVTTCLSHRKSKTCTPAAWMKMLVRCLPCAKSCSSCGSLFVSTNGSPLPSAEAGESVPPFPQIGLEHPGLIRLQWTDPAERPLQPVHVDPQPPDSVSPPAAHDMVDTPVFDP